LHNCVNICNSNVYCQYGALVCCIGPHMFHTSSNSIHGWLLHWVSEICAPHQASDRVFITEDEYPTRGVCFSFTRFDIRTFTCFIRVSLVLGSVYILDRASIGMDGVLFRPQSECSFIPRSCSCAIFQQRAGCTRVCFIYAFHHPSITIPY
jgi:hypothetical protein